MIPKTTLLLTSKNDATTDMLLPFFRSKVIRFDLDEMQLQRTSCHASVWRFGGEEIDLDQCTAVYWRKPAEPIGCSNDVDELKEFEYRQRLYLLRALSRIALRQNIWHLVDPLHEYHFPKPLQLTVAKDYFAVPEWGVFTGGCESMIGNLVSKALAPVPVKDGRFLVTTRIQDVAKLDPAYTWFLQGEVDASMDATVVFCCGRLWGFTLRRPGSGEWVDWRLVPTNHQPKNWDTCNVPSAVEKAIVGFMGNLRLHYARLDFLVDHSDHWWFLEANPNGQFAWLDPDNKLGILEFIAKCAEGCFNPSYPPLRFVKGENIA